MMKKLALGILLTSIAGSAYAADLPAPPSAPYSKAPAIVSPVTNWSGFYIGAMGGYNWQYSQFVFGIEGDGAFADINNSVTQIFPGVGAITASAKVDALGTV